MPHSGLHLDRKDSDYPRGLRSLDFTWLVTGLILVGLRLWNRLSEAVILLQSTLSKTSALKPDEQKIFIIVIHELGEPLYLGVSPYMGQSQNQTLSDRICN